LGSFSIALVVTYDYGKVKIMILNSTQKCPLQVRAKP